MPTDKKLFAVTQWVLKFAIAAIGVLVAVMLLVAIGVVFAWNMGFIAEGLAAATREVGQVNLNIGGWHATFDSAVMADITVADMAKIVLVGVTGAAATLVFVQLILRALRRVVVSASVGDPFIAENAMDIARVAWFLLGVQVTEFLTHVAVYGTVPAPIRDIMVSDPVDIPFTGLFGVLLIFVLARIFKRGTEMRADLEGTV